MKIMHIMVAAACFSGVALGAYQPNEESLSRHSDAPEWFRDAKLGIYFHWGVYSVPAYGNEWYPRHMYNPKTSNFKYHQKNYGDQSEFDYSALVPLWKAENFDAKEWVALFKEAGAKFAGPVAEHHDGFSLWDSKVTPWNSVDKGPKRDIVGELAKEIRANDMKLITTMHHARNNLWEYKKGRFTGHYQFVRDHFPEILDDKEKAILHGYIPRDEFVQMWYDKLVEVIDGYQPDIIWFDSWLDEIPEKTRFEFASYYFNEAEKWNKDVMIVRKQNDMPIEFSVNDHEKSREPDIQKRVWMTDDTISTGSWCYTKNLKIKPVDQVVHTLIDTVSKNGVVLLNISPMADGTIPDNQVHTLKELGKWLKINGEAIYSTRPWRVAGEGPTAAPPADFQKRQDFIKLRYSNRDIRYTSSKDGETLYAIVLGVPEKEVVLSEVKLSGTDIKIELLGYKGEVTYKKNEDSSLTIFMPADAQACDYASSFKLTELK